MVDSKLRIDERAIQGVTVLTLSGEITLDDGDLALGRRIDELVARGSVKSSSIWLASPTSTAPASA